MLDLWKTEFLCYNNSARRLCRFGQDPAWFVDRAYINPTTYLSGALSPLADCRPPSLGWTKGAWNQRASTHLSFGRQVIDSTLRSGGILLYSFPANQCSQMNFMVFFVGRDFLKFGKTFLRFPIIKIMFSAYSVKSYFLRKESIIIVCSRHRWFSKFFFLKIKALNSRLKTRQ